ncbi:HTH-type transcriptional regulator/antitoxin HipB [Marinobacter sp. LV10R520-4]|uniref:helix-turn-helix domain-containing protein n=1 Tax=Marinobacter sp. LV10R520-4 TaxID=1761796 RepID=UPI000BF7E93B|nr:helix-turn-helix domain-containing protein [Marinobacter sp. LV10R520-4]PFG52499.1 HTH-type transcriptional regulator/antitoxin HipB [Marinobacter sp. LV10R520-4]
MKITSPEALSTAIKNARYHQDLSQQATASKVGVKQATVSNFENHPEKSRIETLFKLLSALDLELRVVERGASDPVIGWGEEW